MKKLIILLVALCLQSVTQAQTFAEWFQQGKTQKKYLAQQIAALQAYAIILKKGYDISQKGLGAIGDIKNGDFGLHSLYFNSLKEINPEVAKYPKAKDILTIQDQIRSVTSQSKSKASESNMFTGSEKDYIKAVYGRLDADCLGTLNELEGVTTPGKLEMKDDERIKRIDKLYKDSQSQYDFAKNFGNNVLLLIAQKKNQTQDIQTLHDWYHIQ